ncbi:MAG: pyridoxamine 5'-phosphate oxidase family protein [Proteobacteria bacterium]|nr:pyridoxamine 5'-phosphate oxidase family protein [Pseudomonadota bacterium]
MTTDPPKTLRDTDDDARHLARQLLTAARTAALAVTDPEHGGPYVSRIAFSVSPEGEFLTLISDLSYHARALKADPRAALLIGDPDTRGDPLTHPRLSLRATARVVPKGAEHARRREGWLQLHPKAKLYVDFPDFRYVAFEIHGGHLNAGFGKAYALAKNDLTVW